MNFQDQLQTVMDKLKEPLLPTHLVNWLFSVILLGCVANAKANVNGETVCGFGKDDSTCSSAYNFAVTAFLTASVFVIVELRWEKLANFHRHIYFGELTVAGVYALCFFGYFVKLAAAWGGTDSATKSFVGHGNPGTAIAMCLLSMFSWTGLAYLSYRGWKDDDLGGIERLGTYGGYVDPVTSAYHNAGGGVDETSTDPPVP